MAGASTAQRRMKVFQKGQVVIPIALRKQYDIQVGDFVTVIAGADGILLKPESKGEASLTDRLYGTFSRYAAGRKAPSKKTATRALEKGLADEWPE